MCSSFQTTSGKFFVSWMFGIPVLRQTLQRNASRLYFGWAPFPPPSQPPLCLSRSTWVDMINAPRPLFLNVVSDQKLDDGKVWERGYGGLIIIFLLFSLPLSLTGGEWYWSTLLRSESARDPKWVHMACKSLIIIWTHWDQRMFI